MSKVVMSLPKGMVKNSAVGALIALGSYVALQAACALLIHKEILSMEGLYPAVCVTAAVASFLGCGYSVLRGKEASVLSVSVVVVVFLTLTLAAALLTIDAIAIENGLTGIGLAMAAGGLAAALLGAKMPSGAARGKGSGGKKKARRRRRS